MNKEGIKKAVIREVQSTEKSGELRQLKSLKSDVKDWIIENEDKMRQAGVAEAYGKIITEFNNAIEAVEYEKFPVSAIEDLVDALYEVKREVISPEFNEYMNRANNLLDDIDRSYGSAAEDKYGPYE